MGNFSRDTFDRLKHYVSVRLQQGVPIVDADWNELQDIRKHELETFLRWFVGNGVPLGNDGFAIGAADANDFSIAAGHCLVEGWDVINESDLSYTEQAQLPALTTPETDRTDTVYLDVWEREVDSGEDDQIVNPIIGIETCVRTKREWVVRVAEGATELPAPPPGHVFYPLATLDRKAGEDGIDAVTDLRHTGLTLASLKERAASLEVEKVDRAGDRITGDLAVDGQLGIGTTTPKFSVDSKGCIRALAPGGNPGGWPYGPGAGVGVEILYADWDSIYRGIISAYDRENQEYKPLYVDAKALVLQSRTAQGAGNVGIGTTEPKAKLDVAGTTRTKSLAIIPAVSHLGNFVRRLNVFAYGHPVTKGKEHVPVHLHIRTPDESQRGENWRYDLRGWAYGARTLLDLVWVGTFYQGNVHYGSAFCRSEAPTLEVSQYGGADGHLYLKFGPINPFCLYFVLDFLGPNERVVHDQEGFRVEAREDPENF